MSENDNKKIHVLCSDILNILDRCEFLSYSSSDLQKELDDLVFKLKENDVDYSSLRRVLDPMSSIFSFVFNADKIPTKGNYIEYLMTIINNIINDEANCVYFAGDLILDEKNFNYYCKIFEKNNCSSEFLNKYNICLVNVLNISNFAFNKIINYFQKDESFLFGTNITEPSIDKYLLTYLIPQKTIKFGNKLIYEVSESDDFSNYSFINNDNKKYRLIPILDFHYHTFLTSKPFQIIGDYSDLKHSIKCIFDIDVKGYPEIYIDDSKIDYIKTKKVYISIKRI